MQVVRIEAFYLLETDTFTVISSIMSMRRKGA